MRSTEADVAAALAELGSFGLVGYDLAQGAYYHRELPFDVSRIFYGDGADGPGAGQTGTAQSRHTAVVEPGVVSCSVQDRSPLTGRGLGDPPESPRQVIRMLLDAGYVDCFRRSHPRAPGYTYHTSKPWVRLDYVFVPSGFVDRLVSCEVINLIDKAPKASDHFPLLACIECPELTYLK